MLKERPDENQGVDISESVDYVEPAKVEMPSAKPTVSGDENASDRPAKTTPDEPASGDGPAIPDSDNDTKE